MKIVDPVLQWRKVGGGSGDWCGLAGTVCVCV